VNSDAQTFQAISKDANNLFPWQDKQELMSKAYNSPLEMSEGSYPDKVLEQSKGLHQVINFDDMNVLPEVQVKDRRIYNEEPFKDGGPVKRFMQPTETFKNLGYNSKTNGMSTELSTSVGGPGEVYLVPGYRQGKILQDPEGVFNAYGEHLGGPFKTVQAAEDFGKLRHQYVEQNKNIPAPFKTRDYAMGGSLPGSVGFMYARTNDPAPSNGKYAKKTKASAQDGTMLPNQDASTYIKIPSKQEIDILKSAKSDIINEGNSTNRLRMLKNAVRHDMASEQFKTLEEIDEVDLNKRTLELANKKQQNLNNPRVEFISGNGISKNDVLGYFNPTNSDGVITLSNNINNINELKETSRHEYRHAYDDAGKLLTNYEKQFIGSKTAEGDVDKIKAIGRDQYKYLTNPTEITARLQEIRGGLKDAKVYDASKDKATLEHLNSAKNISGYQDLLQVMKPEDIVDLLNTIATNSPKQGMPAAKNGKKVIKDDRGQWDHPGEITEIGSNQITMQGVPYPVLGISDTGDTQMMYPDQEYQYDGESVTEYPMMKEGGGLQLTKLDQLLNFTNYNNKQPGGWLDKYEDGGTVEADETTQTTQTTQTPDQKPNISKWLPKDPYDAELDPNYVKPKVTKKKPAVVQNTNRAPAPAPAKPQVNVTPNRQTAKGLNFEQIPTADKKKVIIDNYSDKYDYIVEGDKTYYRVKGGKSWDDISDNKTAQKNLLQFIDKNNYWSGYGSGEKDLLYPKTNTKKSTTAAPTKESSYFDNIINGTKKAITDNVINPLSNFSNAASKEVTKLKKSAGSVVDDVVNSVKSGTNSAIKSTDDIGQTIMNGVNRKLKMYTGVGDDDVEVVEPVSKIPKTIKEWYANSGGSSTVIEAKDQSGRQYKQQILPISSITFGSRNRDELKDINTEGMEITTFAPFDSNKKLPDNKTVLAIDQNGKLHTGMYKDFKNKKGFKVSETFMNKIVDLPDNQYKSAGPDNPGYKHPVAKVIDDNGKLVDGSINLLVKDPSKKNFYGSIQGGRVLFVNPSTKEQYLISGSAQHIRDAFKQLKGDNKYLEAYTLDNGTYARGLSYKDGKLTKERLAAYDKENTSGGNGLYIITNTKPVNKYQESYIDNMPNIRTEKSESFKRGHAVKNEIKNIILHHTAYTDAESNDRQLHQQYMTPNNNSSHVVIEEDGKRTIYASPEQVTYHAGESKWNNRSNVNDFGIGVEFQGDTNKRPLTQKQIESFVEYYTPIARKYNLSLKDIITHQMIAPGRKPDITNKEYKRILSYMKSKNFK
jgi:hypothetical protein